MAAKRRRPSSTIGLARVGCVLLCAALCPTTRGAADEAGPMLRIPGLPAVPLPPGAQVFGPGGPERAPDGAGRPSAGTGIGPYDFGRDLGSAGQGRGPALARPGGKGSAGKAPAPKPLTPDEKQAQIRKALTPAPPLAVARRRTLDELYAKLAAAKSADEAQGLAGTVSAIWMRSGSDTANLLMSRAEQAANANDLPLALRVLDRLVVLQPDWAEAWNKRATIRYMAGNLNGAMADCDRVLKLEPNHFGALNGMALILQRTGFERRALQVYRRELSIYPHQVQVERRIEELATAVEGQGI